LHSVYAWSTSGGRYRCRGEFNTVFATAFTDCGGDQEAIDEPLDNEGLSAHMRHSRNSKVAALYFNQNPSNRGEKDLFEKTLTGCSALSRWRPFKREMKHSFWPFPVFRRQP
jgi:hypothetical protein